MNDYQVQDYSAFTNAQATTQTYATALNTAQSAIAECKTKLGDTSIFMGPVQENCISELATLTTDVDSIISNFTSIAKLIGTTSEAYQSGDAQAAESVLTGTDALGTAGAQTSATITNSKMSIPSDPAIAAKKQEWLGNVDDKSQYTYYQGKNLYDRRNKLEVFDNTTGKSWTDDGGSITLKPGETRVLTIKLPTDTGMIDQIVRTTADGSGAYRSGKIVTARSDLDPDPNNIEWVRIDKYQNHKPSDTSLMHNNSYDWIITAKDDGTVTASQTVLWTTDMTKGRTLKAMVDVTVNVQS